MSRSPEQGSTLSVHRAFVVHLAAAGGPRRRRLTGRVEHLSSGEVAWFSSLKELLGFFGAVLEVGPPESPCARREESRDVAGHVRRR